MNSENENNSGQFLTRLMVEMIRNETNSILATNGAFSSSEYMHQFVQTVNFMNSWVLMGDTTDPGAEKVICFELAAKKFVEHLKLMTSNDYFKFMYKNNRVGKRKKQKDSSKIKVFFLNHTL